MKRFLFLLALALLGTAPAAAEETRLEIRALTLDAKFIGTSMAGMSVIIEDADTGEILDQGVTQGTTGDTNQILIEPKDRYGAYSNEESAVYRTALDIEAPRRIRVTVRGPIAQPQAQAEASSVRWVLPGKHIEAGDGWLLVVPGFAVDVLEPGAHTYVTDAPETMTITANVVMICGCPTTPGGTWDSNEIEVMATIRFNGEVIGTQELDYAGQASRYSTTIASTEKGVYEVMVTAFDPRTGNSGIDRTSFIVR